MALCNHCTLRDIKARAGRQGRIVTTRSGGIGTEVYVHERGEVLVSWTQAEQGSTRSNQVAELMSVPRSCVC